MIFERFVSEGLAHYSYLVGSGARAAVVDPRRDVDAYLEAAQRLGARIELVLQTHRNEDYVEGAFELARRTGAVVRRSGLGGMDYAFGAEIGDGDGFDLGRLRLEAIHTPGHTEGHMSYLLRTAEGRPWMLFCGDALFAGEVGRTDLVDPDRTSEMAGKLFDSLQRRILPLGDEVMLCPSHGPGSVCGAAIADRPWTTIGLERRLSPLLGETDRDRFVDRAGKVLERPPYFRLMERYNLEGPPDTGGPPVVPWLSAREFRGRAGEALVLDARDTLAFAAGHAPGALSIWEDDLSAFSGWLAPYDRPILLVVGEGRLEPVALQLYRLGLDRLDGVLSGGMLAWHKAGFDSQRVGMVTPSELQGAEELRGTVLDVRKAPELAQEGAMAGAVHIPLHELPGRMGEVPTDGPVTVLCASGIRSMMAASLLQAQGHGAVRVLAGGMTGWKAAGGTVERAG